MFPFWPGYLVFFVFSIFVTFIFPPFYEQMLRLNMCCSERDVDSPASETELQRMLIKLKVIDLIRVLKWYIKENPENRAN